MERAHRAVQLEAITKDFRLSGFVPAANRFARLSDVLNSPRQDLLLTHASIWSLTGALLAETESLLLKKEEIILVIPRESKAELQDRRLERIGIARPVREQMAVLLAVPPFLARGSLGVSKAGDIEAVMNTLSPFFPLLDARLDVDGKEIEQQSVFLISRPRVLAAGKA